VGLDIEGSPTAAAATAAAAVGGAMGTGTSEWTAASLPARAFLRLGMWQWAMDDVSVRRLLLVMCSAACVTAVR